MQTLNTSEAMKYDSAIITAHYEGQEPETVDLETIGDENSLVDHLWATWFGGDNDEEGEEGIPDRDSFAGNILFTDPEGFAVHLFNKMPDQGETKVFDYTISATFDDLLSVWSDETDSDRREAMGEYLDDMGADDLSDFDEAYQGQYSSGADFAEQFADNVGAVDEKNASWIEIDWEATWERSLRYDYHISDSGHVFRHL